MKLAKFRFWTVVTVLSLGGIGRLVAPTQAQEGMSGIGPRTISISTTPLFAA